jgi:hypothetical protein
MATKKEKQLMGSIICEADLLAEQHVIFTDQYVTRANEELYTLLSGMLSVCLQVQASSISEGIIKQMRKTIKEKYGLKTQVNSTTSAIVVRYIIGSNRKTAHVYGRVLDTAMKAAIAPADLPDYIKAKGGIEAIRQSVVTAVSKADAVKYDNARYTALTNQLLTQNGLGTVQATSVPKLRGMGACDVEFTYLMCTTDTKTNQLKVVASLYPSSTLEQMALDTYIRACTAACLDDGTGKFNEFCKENGLNMDLVHSFMKINAIADSKAAGELLLAVRNTMEIDGKPLPKAKLAA